MILKAKELRKGKGLTQKEMAQNLGIALRTYQLYEKGERQMPLQVAVDFAKFFNVSIDSLVISDDKVNQLEEPEIDFSKSDISVNDEINRLNKRVEELESLNAELQKALIKAMEKL